MKKSLLTFLGGVALVLIVWGIVALTNGKKQEKNDEVPVSAEFVFENVVSADKEYMSLNYGKKYLWYESTILLANFLDEENDGKIESVLDVFQVVIPVNETDTDTQVVLINHTEDGSDVDVEHGMWFGDFVLLDEEIKLTFEEAFARLNESNYSKPHSRYCVLRKEIGPNPSNPQYIFGNTHVQLYVDAVTGDVSEESPAFKGFNIPKPVCE